MHACHKHTCLLADVNNRQVCRNSIDNWSNCSADSNDPSFQTPDSLTKTVSALTLLWLKPAFEHHNHILFILHCASFSLFLSKTSDHTMWQDTKYSNFPQDYIRFKTCSLLMEFYKDYNKRWKQTTEWRKERASTILCNPAHISTGVSESITSCNGVTLSVTTQTSSDNRATSWNLTMHGCRNLFNHYM